MSYSPRRQIKDSSTLNWWGVALIALLTFAGSIFLGKWLGGALISSRTPVHSPAVAQQIYGLPTQLPSVTPVLPGQSQTKRENFSPLSLETPPPIALEPPETQTPSEETSPVETETPSPSPTPSVKGKATGKSTLTTTPSAAGGTANTGTPSPTPSGKGKAPGPEAQNSTSHGAFKIQAGMFMNSSNAYDLQKELGQEGYESHIATISRDDGPHYQVWLGPFKDRDSAESVANELYDLGYHVFVITESQPPGANSSDTSQ